jgi:hypothetical protein
MRKLTFVLALAIAANASAHDLWLQPSSFSAGPGAEVPLSILVGHGSNREHWGLRSDLIRLLRSRGPDGRMTNLMPLIGPDSAAQSVDVRFAQPGTHLIAMETRHSQSDLPARRFNEYLVEEGLTPAIVHRERTGANGRPGREIYSRRAKSLIQIGRPDPRVVSPATSPLGFSLEIVPERDPYQLGPGQDLPVRIIFEGRPLPAALVKLTNLDADEKPVATRRSDGAGRARFAIPRTGRWLITVVWTKPITGNANADYETTFSSLTFGYSR